MISNPFKNNFHYYTLSCSHLNPDKCVVKKVMAILSVPQSNLSTRGRFQSSQEMPVNCTCIASSNQKDSLPKSFFMYGH